MYLIVGLGNPGEQYENTPHNAGFYFLDTFAQMLRAGTDLSVAPWGKDKLFESSFSKVTKNDDDIAVFQRPDTYMNESGRAVKKALKRFGIQNYMKELVLVHDDLDIELGSYKIQKGKSPKDHKGVLSVENSLGGIDFLRVRIGVEARENRNIPGDKFVLIPFSEGQMEMLNDAVLGAIRDLREILHF